MADNELTPLLTTLQGIISQVSPAGRRDMAKAIARNLRASQAERIKANLTPDGHAYEPRKPQKLRNRKGNIKRKMFQKLIRTQWLKAKASADEATVQFVGNATRIARISQFGLRDRVNKQGVEAQYPQRELLGLTEKEKDQIEDLILGLMSGEN